MQNSNAKVEEVDVDVEQDVEVESEEKKKLDEIPGRITDEKTPIVILFGPPSSGKTMILLRLIRYFQSKGNIVAPDYTFRSGDDEKYAEYCDNLLTIANDKYAAKQTAGLEFMLVKILDRATPKYQILEAPGEHFFNDKFPTSAFPRYLNNIMTGNKNKRIWVFVLEVVWEGHKEKDYRNYARKIEGMARRINPNDTVVFLFDKVDQFQYGKKYEIKEAGLAYTNKPNIDAFTKRINVLYDNVITNFEKIRFPNRLFRYECQKVCFSAGSFVPVKGSTDEQGNEVPLEEWDVKPSDDVYCEELLRAIRRAR